MEKQPQDTMIKVRSIRSIIAAAIRLYAKRFWQMLKASWLFISLTVFTTTLVAMFVVYDLYLFMPLAALAVVTELLLWWKVGGWLGERPMRSMWRPAMRHGLLLAVVVVCGLLALLIPCALVALPAIVLTLAEWESQNAVLLGDPQTMPQYAVYLTAGVWAITNLLHVCLRLIIVYIAYFAWGSAEAKRTEREHQIAHLSMSQAFTTGR